MRFQKKICYFFSLCLCIWYLAVCWLAFNPEVSNEYKLFYVERKLQMWPGTNGQN
jgi:hypothetical protein